MQDMKKIDYVSHKIELPVSGTKEELMQQLLLLLDYIGVKLPKRVQKTTKQQRKQVRLPNKSVTLSESQALKILEEFKKGEERRYDGKSWVDFKLTAKQRRRWEDYKPTRLEAEEVSAKIGVNVQEYLIFLCRVYLFEYIPAEKPLPKFEYAISDTIAPDSETTETEFLSNAVFKNISTKLNISLPETPESAFMYRDFLNLVESKLTHQQYEVFVARELDGFSHEDIAERYGWKSASVSETTCSRIRKKLRDDPDITGYFE